jgi:hypothetical protein
MEMRRKLMAMVTVISILTIFFLALVPACTSLYKPKSLESEKSNQLGPNFSKFGFFVLNQSQKVGKEFKSSKARKFKSSKVIRKFKNLSLNQFKLASTAP